MELRQLRRFLAIVERGSLAAAAPTLGLTQQALGASLAKLERECGVVLIDRGPGGAATPTAYGRLLVRHARSMLVAEKRAREDLHAFRDGEGGSVAFGIAEAFAPEVISEALYAFQRARPAVEITMIEGYADALLPRLLCGEIDFLAGADVRRRDDGLCTFPLFKVRDIVIARAQHPLARKRRVTLRQMQPFTWMAPHTRRRDAEVICEAFRGAGLEPPAKFLWTDAPITGLDLLLRDDFLFMASPSMVTSALGIGVIVALDAREPSVERRAGLIYRPETRLNPAAMQLMDDIRTRAHEHIGELAYASPLNPGRSVADAA